jgi:hypothetical protein
MFKEYTKFGSFINEKRKFATKGNLETQNPIGLKFTAADLMAVSIIKV